MKSSQEILNLRGAAPTPMIREGLHSAFMFSQSQELSWLESGMGTASSSPHLYASITLILPHSPPGSG